MAPQSGATVQRLALPEARASWTRGLGDGEPWSLAIAPDAAWLAIGVGHEVLHLDSAGYQVARATFAGEPRGLATLDAARIVVAGFDGAASVVDLAAMRVTARADLGAPLHAACPGFGGETFMGCGDGRVLAWRPGEPAREVTKHPQAVVALATLGDGGLATASLAKSVRVVDAQSGAKRRLYEELSARPWCLAARGTSIAIGVGKTIVVHDVASETASPRLLHAHQGVVSALCWAADGTLWSGGEEGHVLAWRTDADDTRPREAPALDVPGRGRVTALAAISDGLFVLRARPR